MLVSISVIGRMFMNFIPNVQPVTTIIIITAVIMGRKSGVIVAATTIVVSNLYLGFGPWTLPQVISFSLIALIGGSFHHYKDKKHFVYLLALVGGFAGYFHGLVMSIYEYIIFDNFWAYFIAGLPFDTAHALGNIAITLILYKPLKHIFDLTSHDK